LKEAYKRSTSAEEGKIPAGGDEGGWKEEGASSRRQNEPLEIRPRCFSFHPATPCVSRFFIFRYLLVVAARGWGIALRPSFHPSARSSLLEEDTKTSRRLGGSGGREAACLRGAPHSLVPTSRFAFYIIFILLIFRGINVFGALPVG